DLGELTRNRRVRVETGCEGADGDARQQVPDELGNVQPAGDEPEDERHDERRRERKKQSRLVFHEFEETILPEQKRPSALLSCRLFYKPHVGEPESRVA